MYVTVETIEEGQRKCIAVPQTWVNNNILKYPGGKKILNARKKSDSTPKQSWLQIPCKILTKNIGKRYNKLHMLNKNILQFTCLFIESFKAALAQESHDTLFSNTEDERISIKAAQYKRDHPVLSQMNSSNLNDEYQYEDAEISNLLSGDPLDLNSIVPVRNGEPF